jgi:hypothetical protein
MRLSCAVAVATLAACAQASSRDQDVDAAVDARPTDPVDARVDAPTQCTPTTSNLLTNGNLDGTPLATGWTETRIQGELIIRPDLPAGIVPHSSPNVAWLGGVNLTAATDVAEQTVTIPVGATQLVLTGFYDLRTSETVANTDTATIGLYPMSGTTPIAPALALSNSTPTTAWTSINLTFNAATLAGTTVRVRLTSTSGNATGVTSTYVDTLALNATYCPP